MTREDQFNAFWRAYPRRVAKGYARKAFDKAIGLTTLETMLAAIAEYIRHKPERIDFKHPATWLNGECWEDEWQSVPAAPPKPKSIGDMFREDAIRMGILPNDQPTHARAECLEAGHRIREGGGSGFTLDATFAGDFIRRH